MGLGGYLTWTAAIRELATRKLSDDTKILPCEVSGNTVTKIVESPVFKNNPYLYTGPIDKFNLQKGMILPLNISQTNYCLQDTPSHALHKSDKHIIETICEFYEIEQPQLKCELYFSTFETTKFQNDFKTELPKKYVVIEPTSKTNYTPNRAYPFHKWQDIVDNCHGVRFVQVGAADSRVLDGVIDLTGKTTFREASLVIANADALISAEGGLTHVATAVDTTAVVVITGYQSETMVAYPQNVNINIATHGPCGLKVDCDDCMRDAAAHDPGEIVIALTELLQQHE